MDSREAVVWVALTLSASVARGAGLPKRFTQVLKGVDGTEARFAMVLVPAGTFRMGSAGTQQGHQPDEAPEHRVRVKAFYMCTTETTAALFALFYRELGADDGGSARNELLKHVAGVTKRDLSTKWWHCGDLSGSALIKRLVREDTRLPAVGVTWLSASAFCSWLSRKTGKRYRLPSEAEWEYACRAGTTTSYSFGNDLALLPDHAWFAKNAREDLPSRVAQKKPNGWGLYDMHGNVAEWCIDAYSAEAYAQRARRAPATAAPFLKGTVHVARGGSWVSDADALRSAARDFERDWWREADPTIDKDRWWLPKVLFVGFRVVCDVAEQ